MQQDPSNHCQPARCPGLCVPVHHSLEAASLPTANLSHLAGRCEYKEVLSISGHGGNRTACGGRSREGEEGGESMRGGRVRNDERGERMRGGGGKGREEEEEEGRREEEGRKEESGGDEES